MKKFDLPNLARALLPFLKPLLQTTSGSAGVSGTPSPHGLNSTHHSGTLANSQAPQFLLTNGTRPLTGNLAVAAGVTLDGVDLSAHAADPNAHHNAVTVAGGLILSGQQLTVGVGNGTALSGTSVVVDLATNSGLTFSGGDLTLGTPGAVTVSSTNSVSTSTHAHAATSSSNPGAAASLLASDANGRLQLQRIGLGVAPTVPLQARATTEQLRLDYDVSNYASFTVGSGGNLTLAPTGDLILDPVGNDVLPNTNYDINIGSLPKKYLTIHAAELWVETLVAQDTIATIGGRVLVAPTTTLIADCASGSGTLDVKHNQMSSGDRVLLQANLKFEYLAVTSGPTAIAGGYRYSVTRNLDGTGANDWYAGDAVVNTGTTGSGFIDLYSLESVNGRTFDYLFYDDGGVFSANFASLSNFAFFPTTGAVNDAFYFGVSGTTWSTAHLYLAVAGVFSGSFVWEYWNGAAWTAFLPGAPSFTSTGPQTLTVGSPAGWATTTVNGASAYWVRARLSSVLSWTTSPQQGSRRVIREKSQWGPTVVGWTRNSSTFNDVSEAWAIGNLNGLYGYGVDTYGVGLGKYGVGSENYTTFDASNGIRFFTGPTVQAQLTGSTWTLGSVSGGEYVRITASGLELYGNGVKTIELTSAGHAVFGQVATNQGNAYWNASNKRLEFRGSTSGTVVQAYVDTDGAFVAGSGDVVLDVDGLTIDAEGAGNSLINWQAGGTLMAYLGATHGASLSAMSQFIDEQSDTGQFMLFQQGVHGTSGNDVEINIQHDNAGVQPSRIQFNLPGSVVHNFRTTYTEFEALPTFIGDTANTGMTVGLTINQGANDDEALALKSSDVAHGMTTVAETDTYGTLQKVNAADGGFRVLGLTENVIGVYLNAMSTNDDTLRSVNASGGVLVNVSKKSGTGVAQPGANANLFTVRSHGSARFIVDQEGDIHMDATSNINAWDEHDDIKLLAGVREAMNPGLRLAEFVEEARPVLERTGVVTYNPDGHHFISLKKLHALEIDAMRQLHQRLERLEKELEALR